MKHNLEVVKSVLTEVKKQVRSIHDIIPFRELPFFIEKDSSEYAKKFGEETVKRYIAAIELLREVRKKVTTFLPSDELFSTQFIRDLAIGLCGIGECGEQTTFTIYKLLEKNYPLWINRVPIIGKKRNKYDADPYYVHVVVLLNDTEFAGDSTFKTLDNFKSLSNTLLVDPLFGVVDDAGAAFSLLHDIITQYELKDISSGQQYDDYNYDYIRAFSVDRDSKGLASLVSKAREISEWIKKELNLPERIAKIYSPVSLASQSITTTPSVELSTIIQQKLKAITHVEWKYIAKAKTAICYGLDEKQINQMKLDFKGTLNIQRKVITDSVPKKHVAVIAIPDPKIFEPSVPPKKIESDIRRPAA